jgi:hypothetical protein
MTNTQQNVASELQTIAGELIALQSRGTLLAAMWTNEGMANIPDADFAALPPFAHITTAEFTAAATAIAAITTALNAGTPSNWAKMLKIVERVPR